MTEVPYYSNFDTNMFIVKKVKSGWLLPDGTFDECLYGEHSELATMYIDENGWRMERNKERHKHLGEYGRDFLVRLKGYILLDSPSCNDNKQYITFNPLKKYSKKQINTLLDLFVDEPEVYNYIVERINS